MSQENVEIVDAALRALGEHDRGQAASLFAPDAEWHNTSSFPGPSVCVGPDEIIDLWAGLGEGFGGGGNEIEQITDLDRQVVVGMRSWGRAVPAVHRSKCVTPRSSSWPTSASFASAYTATTAKPSRPRGCPRPPRLD